MQRCGVVCEYFNAETNVRPPKVTDDFGGLYSVYIYLHTHTHIYICTYLFTEPLPHNLDSILNLSWKELNCNINQVHALMTVSNVLAEHSATGLPDSCLTQQKSTLSHTACRNYTLASLSSSHLFRKLCQAPPTTTAPPTTKKKLKERTQNEIRHCLAAQLRPISKGLLVNTKFHMTLGSQRMAPYCEQEGGQ